MDVQVLGEMNVRVPPVQVSKRSLTPEEAAELLNVSTEVMRVKIISVPHLYLKPTKRILHMYSISNRSIKQSQRTYLATRATLYQADF